MLSAALFASVVFIGVVCLALCVNCAICSPKNRASINSTNIQLLPERTNLFEREFWIWLLFLVLSSLSGDYLNKNPCQMFGRGFR